MIPLDEFRQFGDPVLRTPCRAFENVDGSAVRLGTTLLERLQHTDVGIGLAANQIGVQRRVFAFDLSFYEDGIVGVLFNPAVDESDGVVVYEEGCLSIPNFFYPVERPETVLVSGINTDGDSVKLELDGIAARLFQHEIDHLDGLLIFDRLDRAERTEALMMAQEAASTPRVPRRRSGRLSL